LFSEKIAGYKEIAANHGTRGTARGKVMLINGFVAAKPHRGDRDVAFSQVCC
jgi:hypothetical protein